MTDTSMADHATPAAGIDAGDPADDLIGAQAIADARGWTKRQVYALHEKVKTGEADAPIRLLPVFGLCASRRQLAAWWQAQLAHQPRG